MLVHAASLLPGACHILLNPCAYMQQRCMQDALQTLWSVAFPGQPWEGLRSDRWIDMGWQRNDPSSDFRGAGLIALQNHLFMAQVVACTGH